MASADLVIDILSELEQRGAGRAVVDQGTAGREHLVARALADDPELTVQLQNGLAALRELDDYLGCGTAARASTLPEIPGYQLEGELGVGGMGTVFKAQQLSLKRPVAMKVMWKHGFRLQQRDQRFRARPSWSRGSSIHT